MCPIKEFKISKVKKNWVHDTLLEMINDRDRLGIDLEGPKSQKIKLSIST